MIQQSGEDTGQRGVSLPRAPWTTRDMAAAIGLHIAASFAIGAAAALADGIADQDPSSELIASAVATAMLLAIALIIAAASGIRLTAMANVTGIAISLAVGAQVAAELNDPRGEFAGIPVAVFQSAIFSSLFLATAWLYGADKHGASFARFGFVRARGRLPYLQALGAWIAALIAVVIWGILTEEIEWLRPPDNTSESLDMADGSLLIAFPIVAIIAPFAEEVFFRGFLLTGLRKRLNAHLALIVSAAIFAVFHFDPGLYIPIFALGLVLGWVYLRTGSIWPSIFVHTAHNSLALYVTWQELGS